MYSILIMRVFMKKIFLVFSFFSCISTLAFPYTYKTDDFEISGNKVNSLVDSNFASVNGNELNYTFDGRSNKRVLKNYPHKTKIIFNDEILDFLTEMAFEEIRDDVRTDGTFCAGAKWPSAWTRDMSYAIDLSLSYLFPKESKKSLETRVDRNSDKPYILQDTGTGGSWPCSSDRIIWAKAAYQYGLFAQDDEYFKDIYEVIKNTLNQDDHTIFDPQKNLYRGEQSFLDWREQTYPRWMTSQYIADSFALGTNMDFYSAHKVQEKIASRLGLKQETQEWAHKANRLKKAIEENFYIESKGYYGAYLISGIDYLYQGYETLGESLAVLEGISDESSYCRVLEAVRPYKWNLPVVVPQLPATKSYHNDAVWPFVTGYRINALKKAKCFEELEREFAASIYTTMIFGTYRENYTASTCDRDGTELSSDRQLWSVAAWLSEVFQTVCGINFTQSCLEISPWVPSSLGDSSKMIQVKDLEFGNSLLTLEIKGRGNIIQSARINGKNVPVDSQVLKIPYNSGKVKVELVMAAGLNSTCTKTEYVLNAEDVTTLTPLPLIEQDKKVSAFWKQKNDSGWTLYKNGVPVKKLADREVTVKGGAVADCYYVIADSDKDIPVLPGTPFYAESKNNTIEIEINRNNFGTEITGQGLTDFETNISIKKNGVYKIDFNYQNGNGPVNTGDKCAVHSLVVDGTVVKRIPFPQLGNWNNVSNTAPVFVELSKGSHTISLVTDEWCRTSYGRLNPINLKSVKLVRTK